MLELAWWLLQPSSVLVLLLLVGLVTVRLRWYGLSRFVLGLGVAALLAVVLLPVNELLAGPVEARVLPPASLPPRVDGVVVLGGALEWRVARARDRLAVNDAAERLMAAAALARRYPQAELVFTGVFADQLEHDFQAAADPQSLIFGEAFAGREPVFLGDARSTFEDAILALERLDPQSGESWLLVTSALHMPRALGTFETVGWNLVPYPVDYRTSGEIRFAPTLNVAAALADIDRTVRELGALWIYRRTGRIANP